MTHQDQGIFHSPQLPSFFQMLGDAKEVECAIRNQGDILHQGSHYLVPLIVTPMLSMSPIATDFSTCLFPITILTLSFASFLLIIPTKYGVMSIIVMISPIHIWLVGSITCANQETPVHLPILHFCTQQKFNIIAIGYSCSSSFISTIFLVCSFLMTIHFLASKLATIVAISLEVYLFLVALHIVVLVVVASLIII